MSTSTAVVLAYGYNLVDSPEFTGLDAGQDFPDWWDGEDDFDTVALRRLLQAEPEAKYCGLPVGFETHCSTDAPEYLMVVTETVTTALRGHPETITSLAVPDYANDRLAWAVETLGLDVGGQKPRWLLAAYWER